MSLLVYIFLYGFPRAKNISYNHRQLLSILRYQDLVFSQRHRTSQQILLWKICRSVTSVWFKDERSDYVYRGKIRNDVQFKSYLKVAKLSDQCEFSHGIKTEPHALHLFRMHYTYFATLLIFYSDHWHSNMQVFAVYLHRYFVIAKIKLICWCYSMRSSFMTGNQGH